jgi:hypothetical protein
VVELKPISPKNLFEVESLKNVIKFMARPK